VSEKGCGRVALLSGRTITLAMGVPACPREHHGALGARVSRILSRLRRSDHLTAILIGVGSGVFIIAAGRIFRQIIVVHTASAANRRLVSTADSRYLALILVRLVCTGHDANTLYCTRFLPWSAGGRRRCRGTACRAPTAFCPGVQEGDDPARGSKTSLQKRTAETPSAQRVTKTNHAWVHGEAWCA